MYCPRDIKVKDTVPPGDNANRFNWFMVFVNKIYHFLGAINADIGAILQHTIPQALVDSGTYRCFGL
jgi:hypothetical protein